MRVSLIDADSKIPNLALMKLSSYHKNQGNTVALNLPNPDIIYCSIVYTKNKGKSKNNTLDNTPVVYGGSGYDLKVKLPLEIEYIKPDYELYPSEYSQGFTTRGCTRKCWFCYVPVKEGGLQLWQHPKEFCDPKFDTVNIMDNNWLAHKKWFLNTSGWLMDQNLKIIENGLDIRLVNSEIARQLKKLRIKIYHFAYDTIGLRPIIAKKIQLLKSLGYDLKNRCVFYVYCHEDKMFEDALYRAEWLKSRGATPYIMFNPMSPKTSRIKRLIKWCNTKQLVWSISYQEYNKICHT